MEENNKLEEWITLSSQSPAFMLEFYKVLLESRIFIIPLQEKSVLQWKGDTLQPGSKIAFAPIWIGEQDYLPIFSSLPRLQQYIDRPVQYMAMWGRHFFELTYGADVILNPGSEDPRILPKEMIRAMLDGSLFTPRQRIVQEETKEIMIALAKQEPTELLRELSKCFASVAEVEFAYHALMWCPALNEQPHSMIAVHTTGDWKDLMARVGPIVHSVPLPYPPVDFIKWEEHPGQDGWSSYLRKNSKPFYQRKK